MSIWFILVKPTTERNSCLRTRFHATPRSKEHKERLLHVPHTHTHTHTHTQHTRTSNPTHTYTRMTCVLSCSLGVTVMFLQHRSTHLTRSLTPLCPSHTRSLHRQTQTHTRTHTHTHTLTHARTHSHTHTHTHTALTHTHTHTHTCHCTSHLCTLADQARVTGSARRSDS